MDRSDRSGVIRIYEIDPNSHDGAADNKTSTDRFVEKYGSECGADERCHVEKSDHISNKRHASSFHGTELDSTLISMGCDALILPETRVSNRPAEQHEAHLWDLGRKFADVKLTGSAWTCFESL